MDGYPLGQQFGYLVDRSNGSGYISTDEELAKYTKMYSGSEYRARATLFTRT